MLNKIPNPRWGRGFGWYKLKAGIANPRCRVFLLIKLNVSYSGLIYLFKLRTSLKSEVYFILNIYKSKPIRSPNKKMFCCGVLES